MITPYLRPKSAKAGGLYLAAPVLLSVIFGASAMADPLPLSVALTRAAAADPATAATAQRLDAATANIRQAGARPNPSLGLEVENALGSGPYSGIDRAETTLSYQQQIERGGKRQARIGAASARRDLVRAEGRARAWAVMAEVHSLWIEATAAQAEVALSEERLKMATQAQAEIARRVGAARDPLFAGSLADADLANARIAHDQAVAKAQALRTQLAGYWGGQGDFDLDPLWLEDTAAADVPPVVMATPDIELLRARQRLAAAEIEVETSRRVQNPTVQAGVRHYKADDAFAFVVGGSVPLGRYDTNKGAIERSRAEAMAAATDIEAADRIRARDIAASTLRLKNLASEARRIQAEVIPQAERAVVQVREGFARGGFTYRDVLGAQEALMTAKTRRLEVLKSFQLERAGRERLSGQYAPLIPAVEGAQ